MSYKGRLERYINRTEPVSAYDTIDNGYKTVSLYRKRGDDYPVRCQISIDGNSNLTGSTIKMGVRKPDDTIESIDGGGSQLSSGIVDFTLPTGVYDTVGTYSFEVEIVSGINGKRYTVGGGTIDISDDLLK